MKNNSLHSTFYFEPLLTLGIEKMSLSEEETPFISNPDNVSSFPFFNPAFQEADQVLLEFYQSGSCDEEGNPAEEIDQKEMPLIPYQEFSDVFDKIFIFLKKPRQLDATIFPTGKGDISLEIPLIFYNFFQYLIYLKDQSNGSDVSDLNKEREIKQWASNIQDILLIGSSVLNLLKEKPFLYAAFGSFEKHFDRKRIEEWFQMEHVQQIFSKESNDQDFRVLSHGDLNHQAKLSEQTITYLSQAILTINSSFFRNQLSLKHHKYKKIKAPDNETIKKWSVLEFGGINKRKLVDTPKTQFAIVGCKTIKDKPTDFLFVGLKDGKPTLENMNLSSTNCWTLSLHHLIFSPLESSHFLKINCQPFSATKALIDILCAASTISAPNADAWCRFLRDCIRSLQPEIEKKMVDHLFEYKTQFLALRKCETTTPNADYIFLLLEWEVVKHQRDSKTQKIDAEKVIPFLFRACQSLQNYASFSDQECHSLWSLAYAEGWLNLITDGENKNTLSKALKQALIVEKVPFSVVTAWIGLLCWVTDPLSATSHCQKPVFHLKSPLRSLFPIQPLKDGQILHEYAKQHRFPDSLQHIYQSMTSNSTHFHSPSPLLKYFKELNIDILSFRELAKDLLTHSVPTLNFVGLQLYLGCSSFIPDQLLLDTIFQNFPHFLKGTPSHHTKEVIHVLKQLSALFQSDYEPALQLLTPEKSLPLEVSDWIALLIQTKAPNLALMAYNLWKDNEKKSTTFVVEHTKLGWSLYQALGASHPRLTLSLLKTTLKPSWDAKPDEQKIDIIFFLIQSYQRMPQNFAADLENILPFIDFIFGKDKNFIFNTKRRQNALVFLIEMLLENPEKVLAAFKFFQQFPPEIFSDIEAKHRFQYMRTKLGEALLNIQEQDLSFILFQQISQEDVENQTISSPLSQWIVNLCSHQLRQPEKVTAKILDLFECVTLTEYQERIRKEFFQFSEREIDRLKGPENPSIDEQEFLGNFDQILGSQKMIPLIDQSKEEWKKLLLDYLENSLSLSSETRIEQLWLIYGQVLSLLSRDKSLKASLSFFTILVSLLKISSQTSLKLNPNIVKILKGQYGKIFDQFKKNGLVEEARDFLEALNHYQLVSSSSLIPYYWWIGQQDFKQANKISLEFFERESFENLSSQICESDDAYVLEVLSRLLQSPSFPPLKSLPWIKHCLKAEEKESSVISSDLIDKSLVCIHQLITIQEWSKAFYLLNDLSHLPPTKIQEVSDLWTLMAFNLVKTASVELNRQLFLSRGNPLFQAATPQLYPLVQLAVQQCLSIDSPSSKQLVVDLCQHYSLKDAEHWGVLWQSLNVKPDATLIRQLWEIFKIQSPVLVGSERERAKCWTQAFDLLQKTHHPDLLTYFYDHKWLKIFEHPQTAEFKWKALESVFLRMMDSITPPSISVDSFDALVEWKSNLSSETHLLNPWIQKIELEMIKKLVHSSDAYSLRVVSTCLLDSFKRNGSDKASFNNYLNYFENFIKAYLKAKDLSEDDKNHLKANIDQMLEIVKKVDADSLICCLSVIENLLQDPTDLHIGYAHQLVFLLLQRNKPQEIKNLKLIFAKFISLLLKSSLLSKETFAKEHIKKAFDCMNLPSKEKASLSYLFFEEAIKLSSSQPLTDEINEAKVDIFVQWAPYFVSQPQLIQKSLKQIMPFVMYYNQNQNRTHLDENKFKILLKKILNIKYQTDSKEPHKQEGIESYHSGVIESVHSANPNHEILLSSLFSYGKHLIHKHADQAQDVIRFLNTFVYLYPPQPSVSIDEEKEGQIYRRWEDSKYEAYSKILLEKASQKNIFKDNPQALKFLEIYLNIIPTNEVFDKKDYVLFEKSISQLLNYNIPESLARAIDLYDYVHKLALNNEFNFDNVFILYKNVLNALKPHLLQKIVVEKKEEKLLLDVFMRKMTTLKVHKETLKVRDFMFNTLDRIINFSLEAAIELDKSQDEQSIFGQACYLECSCSMLFFTMESVGYPIPLYLKHLEKILFLIKSNNIKNLQTSEEIYQATKSFNLCIAWMQTLVLSNYNNQNKKVSEVSLENTKKREVLFKGLNDLLECEFEKEDSINRAVDNILDCLHVICLANPSNNSWINPQQPDILRLFREIIENLNSYEMNDSQRLALNKMQSFFYRPEECDRHMM